MTEYDVVSDLTSDTSSILSEDIKSQGSTVSQLDDDTSPIVSSNNTEKKLKIESDETESCEVSDNDSEVQETEEKWEDILGSGSLMKLVVTEGKPNSRPERSQNCLIDFECTLEDGTVVEKQDNFKVQLGDCEVVQGLELALGLMNEGETCKLKVESRLAYGGKGLDAIVPPNTSVYFQVKLISVLPDEELETLSITERRVKGNKKRERGNWWYSRGENQLAIQCYRRALDYLDEVEGGIKFPTDDESAVTDSVLQQLLEDRINVSNNMAAAQLKLEYYDAALQSLQTVLRCQPDNVKALFRKAKVYRAKNDIQAALNCLKKAEKVVPQDSDILREITSLEKIKEKQKKSEKELAQRMFNGLQNKTTKHDKKFIGSSNFMKWLTVGVTVAVGLAGVAVYRLKFT